MVRKILIDGNNLIPKISSARSKGKNLSRADLIVLLERIFFSSKDSVVIFFDGFKNEEIRTNRIKIIYSDKKKADELIRREIENNYKSQKIIVASSDHEIINLAKVCGCEIVRSEDFEKRFKIKNQNKTEESEKPIISNEESKRMFGLK